MPAEDTNPLNPDFTRRRLLGGAALGAGALAASAFLPDSVQAALAATPPSSGFDPSQIKHVVIAMQENRSFDHYFGTLQGVRGFADPTVAKLSTGRSLFYQPDPTNPRGYLLPYRLNTTNTAAQAIPSTSHQWQTQHAAWNNGKMDSWVKEHIAADGANAGPYTMGYYTRDDLPFHYALADAFTICDNYRCSMMGPTHPNRIMLMTGTVDPNGLAGGPALDNNGSGAPGGYTWTTYPERLQAAGVSWKVYQQSDNYGCNALQFMAQYNNLAADDPLNIYANGVSTLYDGSQAEDAALAFEEDCQRGTLPTVSWIIPTGPTSEHPNNLPAAGADFIASKIAAVAANPELWNSTVFILNYDENDGLFDHVAPVTPPPGTPDEFVTLDSPTTPGGGLPIGSGFRVPCIIVSPWTAGGRVFSGLSDHTSVLQFLEVITGIEETNISAWRRSTFSDLTGAFAPTPAATPPYLPPTQLLLSEAEYAENHYPLPAFPGAAQTVPTQEPGTRPILL